VKLIKVMPIGRTKRTGFVTSHGGCGVETWEEDAFPDSPLGREARALRRRFSLTMGDVARAFGITVVDVSDIERGRQEPESWSEWRDAVRRLGEGR